MSNKLFISGVSVSNVKLSFEVDGETYFLRVNGESSEEVPPATINREWAYVINTLANTPVFVIEKDEVEGSEKSKS